MTIEQVVGKYEAEIADIDAKIGALNERKAFVSVVLKEIRQAAGAVKPTATGTRTPAKTAPAPAATAPAPVARAKTRKTKSGKPSAKAAILKVVGDASEPVTAADIINGAVKLSGGKANSVRTQMNALSKEGKLQPVPYSGRGFKYRLPK